MTVLDVQTAEIATVQAEVRCLTVSGKQVTLAVFRQLEESPLLTGSWDLQGPAWGRVNYHPDRCTDEREHMHVVWQRGDELRRSRIDRPAPHDGVLWAESDAWLRAAVSGGWRPLPSSGSWFNDRTLRVRFDDEVCARFDMGVDLASFLDVDACRYSCTSSASHPHWKGASFEYDGRSRDEERADLIAEFFAEQAMFQKRVDQYEALKALPQLFIAV